MKKILLIICIIIVITSINNVKGEEIRIPNDAIRLRVVANSNEQYDQLIKMKISLEVEKEIMEILKDVKNPKKAEMIIKNNLPTINMKINKVLKEENYKEDFKLSFGNTFFPEKKYKGVTYEQGLYTTLLITLGSGQGKNWWCVLFPPLCLMEAEENDTGEVEYKFFIKELINKYL